MANKMEMDEKSITTIIAEDLEIKGTVKFKSSLMIKGVLEGEIISEGLLVVGPTAKVTATITTKNFISHGEVTGNVTASEQVVLKDTSKHKGDISTPDVTIESGSLFNGSCIMPNIPKKSKTEIPQAEEPKVEEEQQTDSVYSGYVEQPDNTEKQSDGELF